ALGFEITLVVDPRRHLQRLAPGDLQVIAVESDDLAGVVGEEADGVEPEIEEDLGADPVVAQVRLESEPLVRLDGIQAPVLQVVGLELVAEPDAAPLLLEVDHGAVALPVDPLHGGMELLAAVASCGAEDVTR